MIRKPPRVQFDHKSLDDASAVAKTINRIQDAVLNTVDQVVQQINNPTIVAARYIQTAAQTLTNNTDVIVNFDRRVYDTVSAVTIAGDVPWACHVPDAGYYLVTAQVTAVLANVGGTLAIKIFQNGVAVPASGPRVALDGTLTGLVWALNLAHVIQCAAGDTLAVAARVTGGALTTSTGSTSSIEITKIG